MVNEEVRLVIVGVTIICCESFLIILIFFLDFFLNKIYGFLVDKMESGHRLETTLLITFVSMKITYALVINPMGLALSFV